MRCEVSHVNCHPHSKLPFDRSGGSLHDCLRSRLHAPRNTVRCLDTRHFVRRLCAHAHLGQLPRAAASNLIGLRQGSATSSTASTSTSARVQTLLQPPYVLRLPMLCVRAVELRNSAAATLVALACTAATLTTALVVQSAATELAQCTAATVVTTTLPATTAKLAAAKLTSAQLRA